MKSIYIAIMVILCAIPAYTQESMPETATDPILAPQSTPAPVPVERIRFIFHREDNIRQANAQPYDEYNFMFSSFEIDECIAKIDTSESPERYQEKAATCRSYKNVIILDGSDVRRVEIAGKFTLMFYQIFQSNPFYGVYVFYHPEKKFYLILLTDYYNRHILFRYNHLLDKKDFLNFEFIGQKLRLSLPKIEVVP